MAKAKLISDFERDVIRVGIARGHSAAKIGDFIGRTRQAVHQHMKIMRDEGTLDNMPFGFVVNELSEAIDGQK